MKKFENQVQFIKYSVLKEIARIGMDRCEEEEIQLIPEKIIPGPDPISRCCIYKERAIAEERVNIILNKNDSENVINVLETACDECPIYRFVITEACRGCLAHRCSQVCPVDAIYHVGQKAYIDQNKCIECGRCKSNCPYNAIAEVGRPCTRACPVDAISIDERKKAVIDNEKCIQCGACVYQCPFGAIVDKSSIFDVINLLKLSKDKKDMNLYAVVAPAISSQYSYAKIGQVKNAIKKLGFKDVIEAALGADIVAMHETKEFEDVIKNEGYMTSSCCPAFVNYIEKNFPMLEGKISSSVSPMIAVSRLIKNIDSNAKVVFIGPCTAKKMEITKVNLKGSTDFVLTFEELMAMLDAANIKVEYCEDENLDNASFFGRIFARSGGLTEAIRHIIEKEKIDVDFTPVICDGIKDCEKALKMAKVNKLKGNFIEGMVCEGGCIGGPVSLHHGKKDRFEVDKYGKLAVEKDVKDSLRIFDIENINLDRNKK